MSITEVLESPTNPEETLDLWKPTVHLRIMRSRADASTPAVDRLQQLWIGVHLSNQSWRDVTIVVPDAMNVLSL